MKKTHIQISALLLFLILAGCAPKAVAPVYFIPKNIESSDNPLVPESFSVKVTLSKNDVETYITANNFRIALVEAIKRANLFGSDVDRCFVINTYVYKASFPYAGGTMKSELCAKYSLTDPSFQEVWAKDICYKGEATMGEALLGPSRSLLAFNRANHGHVTLLISSLRKYLYERTTKTKKRYK